MTGTLTLMKEPMCTHLVKVPGSINYYFRRKIPTDLVHHYKKAEIKKSLRTADKREAGQSYKHALSSRIAYTHNSLPTGLELTRNLRN